MVNPNLQGLQKYVERLNPAQRYLVGEFVDNYEDGVMSRRDLIERVYRITGSVAAAAATLLAMGCGPETARTAAPSGATATVPAARTATTGPATGAGTQPSATAATTGAAGSRSPLSVAENDPAVMARPVTFPNGADTIMAYLARPAAAGKYAAVMICHENRGTGPHYEDVARRFAKAGYVGISLDLLSRQGGTAAVPANQVGGVISASGAAERFVEDFRTAMAYLRQQEFVDGARIAMTGYCFGGGVTYNVVGREPTLKAAAPYYGAPMFPDELRNAKAAVLGVYGETDTWVNATIPTVEQNLRAAGVPFETKRYPGAGHAFYNDTGGSYNEAAATAAWRDTLDWFKKYLVA